MNAFARHKVQRRASVKIATNAKVNYRGIAGRPPGKLSVGEGSIFEGSIASDRAGSVVEIGKDTFVGNSMIVTASRVEIGDDVLVSWGCTIIDHDSHSPVWECRSDDVRNYFRGRKDWTNVSIGPIVIKDKAWLGCNVIVLKGVTVGEGAVVAAGSVVTKDVPDYTLVAGNPARVVRSLRNEAR